MKPILLASVILLSACATTWTNPKNPGADLQADQAACQRDVERQVRLEDMIRPPGVTAGCAGPNCSTEAQVRDFQKVNVAVGAQKRCMASKGWRQE